MALALNSSMSVSMKSGKEPQAPPGFPSALAPPGVTITVDTSICGIDTSEMHRSIKQGDIERVEQLIGQGLVNARTECGKTPLMVAGYYCQKEIMDLLLRNGSVINALDEVTKDTAAHYVTMSLCGSIRQCGCMIVLAEYGADVNIANEDGYTVFELAKKNGNEDIATAYASVAACL